MMRTFLKALPLALSVIYAGAFAQSYEFRQPVTGLSAIGGGTINFGNITVGQTAVRQYVFTNTRSSATTIGQLAISGAGVAVSSDNCTSKTVQPGQSCTFMVSATPAAAGSFSGEVDIVRSSSAEYDKVSLVATGVVTDYALMLVESFIDFGPVNVRDTSAPKTIDLVNTGQAAVTVADVAVTQNTLNYTVDAGSCGTTLNPGDRCPVTITFAPVMKGSLQATMAAITDSGDKVYVGTVAGEGVQGAPAWSTAGANFVNIPVGTTSAPQSITLSNIGKGDLIINSLTLSGDSAFALTSNTCQDTLAPLSQCTIQVTASPVSTTARTGTLTLKASNTATTSSSVQLYLTAVDGNAPPASTKTLSVTPSSATFTASVGASTTQSFTVKNTGDSTVTISDAAISSGASYYTRTHNCSTLSAGQTCTVTVTFTPTTTGTLNGTLSVKSDATNGPNDVTLSGTGNSAGTSTLSASASSLDFSSVSVNTTSSKTVTLTNAGTSSIKVTSVQVTAGGTDYTASTACSTIAAGGTCTVTVNFKPTATGSRPGTLTIQSDAANSPLTISLAGSGSTALDGKSTMIVAASNVSSYDIGLDGSIYIAKFPYTIEKYTASGALVWSKTASLSGCTNGRYAYLPQHLVVDKSGNVHLGFNCIYTGSDGGAAWKSMIAKYSPDLDYLGYRQVSYNSKIVNATANRSDYIGLELYELISGYPGSKHQGATRLSSDYTTMDGPDFQQYGTTNENALVHGSTVLAGTNGGFTAYLVTESTYSGSLSPVIKTITYGGGFTTNKSVIQYSKYQGAAASSPITGDAYAVTWSTSPTTYTLYRITNPKPLITSSYGMSLVRVDNQGCLYTYQTLADGTSGIMRTDVCGY